MGESELPQLEISYQTILVFLGQAAKSVNHFQGVLYRKMLIHPFRNNLPFKITISNACIPVYTEH